MIYGARGILVVDSYQISGATAEPVIAAVYGDIADVDYDWCAQIFGGGLYKDLGGCGLAARISNQIGGVRHHTAARRYDNWIIRTHRRCAYIAVLSHAFERQLLGDYDLLGVGAGTDVDSRTCGHTTNG